MSEDKHRTEPEPDKLCIIWKTHVGLKPHQFTYWKKKFDRTDDNISFIPLGFSVICRWWSRTRLLNLFTLHTLKPSGYLTVLAKPEARVPCKFLTIKHD